MKALYDGKKGHKLPSEHLDKITDILTVLDSATSKEELNLPGFRLHNLKGSYKGYISITVQANWRIVFKFDKGQATEIDYLDYH